MVKEAIGALVRVLRDPVQLLVAACLALALTIAGVSRAFIEMSVGGVGTFPMPGDNLPMLVACALVCALCACFHRRVARFLRGPAGRALVVVFALAAVAALEASQLVEDGQGLLFWAGIAVRTAGLLCLLAVCTRDNTRDATACVAQMAWGVTASVVLDLVFLLLAPSGVAVVGLAVPLALGVLLTLLDRRLDAAGDAAGASDAVTAETEGIVEKPGLPWGALAIFGLYGVVGGLSSSQAHSLGTDLVQPTLLRTCLVNDAGLLLGAALLVVGTLWLARRRTDPFALRYLLLPAYLVAIFLAPVTIVLMGAVVPLLMAISQALFYGLIWVFPCRAAAGERLRCFAAVCGFFFVGTYAGMWVGGDLLPATGGDLYMVAAAFALAVLLMFEFAPRLAGARPDAEAGADAEASPALAARTTLAMPVAQTAPIVDAAAGIDALADRAARAWGLTPRERAVLPGLLRGRSVAWVAESLTVSKNTVHTHMRNIYQKADVHSQEELIDAAEALG